jgi:hypothetical protein
MTEFRWREGYHGPRGLDVKAVGLAIEKAKDPAVLFEHSKASTHCLHSHLWSEGDQVWANRARLEECRQISMAVLREYSIGGRTYSIRAVEYVRQNGGGTWATMNEILNDHDLEDGYLAEIERLNDQAARKMESFRQLRKQMRRQQIKKKSA